MFVCLQEFILLALEFLIEYMSESKKIYIYISDPSPISLYISTPVISKY